MMYQTSHFISNRIVVSDIEHFTSGSAPCSVVAQDGNAIYTTYLASRTGKGECHDIVAVADIPLDNPAAARNIVLFEKGQTVCGYTIDDIINTTAFAWKGNVRAVVAINNAVLAWRDWNPQTKAVCGEGLFKFRFGNQTQSMTPEATTEYLTAMKCTGFNVFLHIADRILASSKLIDVNGALYGTITSSCSQPVICKCTDGETFEPVGFVPSICQYECQLAYHDGRFFALGRGMEGDNVFYSDDMGATFTPMGRMADGLCRQQLLVCKDKLLMASPAPDELPSIVRNGRNNFHLLAGTGTEFSDYTEILHAFDPMGLIMFELLPVKDDVYVLWSNAERYPDYVKWGAVQGKDQILIARLELNI